MFIRQQAVNKMIFLLLYLIINNNEKFYRSRPFAVNNRLSKSQLSLSSTVFIDSVSSVTSWRALCLPTLPCAVITAPCVCYQSILSVRCTGVSQQQVDLIVRACPEVELMVDIVGVVQYIYALV